MKKRLGSKAFGKVSVAALLAILLWMPKSSSLQAGMSSSGGSRVFLEEKNPWFSSLKKEVTYCIDIDTEHFGLEKEEASKVVAEVLQLWKSAFAKSREQEQIENEEGIKETIEFYQKRLIEHPEEIKEFLSSYPETVSDNKSDLTQYEDIDFSQIAKSPYFLPPMPIATQNFTYTECKKGVDLVFNLGTTPLDPDTGFSYSDMPNLRRHLGVAIVTGTDRKILSSRGFVYISPKSGQLKVESFSYHEEIKEDFWRRDNHYAFKGILSHELGHVFGVPHLEDTFMEAGYFPYSYSLDNMNSQQKELIKGLENWRSVREYWDPHNLFTFPETGELEGCESDGIYRISMKPFDLYSLQDKERRQGCKCSKVEFQPEKINFFCRETKSAPYRHMAKFEREYIYANNRTNLELKATAVFLGTPGAAEFKRKKYCQDDCKVVRTQTLKYSFGSRGKITLLDSGKSFEAVLQHDRYTYHEIFWANDNQQYIATFRY